MTVIELKYARSGIAGSRREDEIALRDASSVELMYSCFAGNVKFRVGEVDLSANFGWIPLLHFANNLDLIFANIRLGDEKYYYFTESQDSVKFTACDEGVVVECSYAPGVRAVVDRVKGRVAVRAAGSNFVLNLEKLYPGLRANPVFAQISARLADGPQ